MHSSFDIGAILVVVLLALCSACAGGSSSAPSATAGPPSSPTAVTSPVFVPSPTLPAPIHTPTSTPTRRPSPSPTDTLPAQPTPTPTSAVTAVQPPTPSPTSAPPPAVRVYRTTATIATYPYQDFLRQEFSTQYRMPVWRLDWDAYESSAPRPAPRQYEQIVMENAYLRVSIIPELGGRIYECSLKAAGRNLLYQNAVLKPTRWGPPEQGWWLAAGGIEFCLPVEEHGYESATPWQAEIVTAGREGRVRLTDSTEQERLRAQVDVILPAGEARFLLQITLHNGTASTLPLQFWSNAMMSAGDSPNAASSLRFFLPARQARIHSTSDPRLPAAGESISWPYWQGTDWSFPDTWQGWLGVFAWPQAEFGFAGVYDVSADIGLVRAFPPQTAHGVKAFGFGGPSARLPASLWTDDGSYYVELHGGLTPAFGEPHPLAPGEQLRWQETWFPVAGLHGLTAAGPSGAVRAAWNADTKELGLRIWPAAPLRGTAVLRVDDREIGRAYLDNPAGRVIEIAFPWGEEPMAGSLFSLHLLAEDGSEERWQGYYYP